MESLIQSVVFITYVGYILKRYGQLKSISESWYYTNYWFTLFCFSIGIIQILRGELMFFISGSFLIFVGSATDFKGWTTTKHVHNVGAIGSITFSLIGLYIYYGLWWPVIPILISWFGLSRKNRIFWTEVVAFFTIIITPVLFTNR